MNRSIAKKLSVVALLALSACSPSAVLKGADSNQAFVDASQKLGEPLEIEGFLAWRSNDYSLYPTKQAWRNSDRRNCLPVLILAGKSELTDAAERLHGRKVKLTGVVAPVAPPGMDSVFACRETGLEVTGIAPAG